MKNRWIFIGLLALHAPVLAAELDRAELLKAFRIEPKYAKEYCFKQYPLLEQSSSTITAVEIIGCPRTDNKKGESYVFQVEHSLMRVTATDGKIQEVVSLALDSLNSDDGSTLTLQPPLLTQRTTFLGPESETICQRTLNMQTLIPVSWTMSEVGSAPAQKAGAQNQASAEWKELRFQNAGVTDVPVITLPETFRTDQWKNTDWNGCRLSVEPAGEAASHQLHTIATPEHEVFIEVFDDAWIPSLKARANDSEWMKQDHLEIWALMDGAVVQWGIRVKDGKVFSGFGSPAVLSNAEVFPVERKGRTESIRMKIKLPETVTKLSIFYGDSDKKRKPIRFIGANAFVFGKSALLGNWMVISPDQARCDIEENRLQLKQLPLKPTPGSGKPLIQKIQFDTEPCDYYNQ